MAWARVFGCSRGLVVSTGFDVLVRMHPFIVLSVIFFLPGEGEKRRGGWNLFCGIDCIFRVYVRKEEQLVIPH